MNRIILNPIERRYIATCPFLEERMSPEEAKTWRDKLRYSSEEYATIEMDNGFALAFPHITRLYRSGEFNDRNIQDYFEGGDEKSHNMRMYLFVKKLKRKKAPEHFLRRVVRHVNICAVKPADIDRSIVWFFGGEKEVPIDENYFDMERGGRYAFVHGESDKGNIVVRYVSRKEFERMRVWFEKRNKSKRNPFKTI